MPIDLLIYPLHIVYWTAFGVAAKFVKGAGAELPTPAPPTPAAESTATAAWSRTLLGIHFVAFGVMYFGIGAWVIPDRVATWFQGQRVVGGVVIALGGALLVWARVWFQSWRFRARLDAGHQLATGGPYHFVRHPIYLGLDLLALGSAVWVPNPFTWVGVVLMVIGSDLRGRAEERLLTRVFGARYAEYIRHTPRFIPGLY